MKRKIKGILGICLCVLTMLMDILVIPIYGLTLDKGFITVKVQEDEWQRTQENALETAQKLEEEGIVLLKNQDFLPMEGSGTRINLLGYRAYNPIYGGTGSGGSSYTENRVDLVQALEEEGFLLNPDVKEAYEKVSQKEKNTFEVDFSIKEYAGEEKLAGALDQEYLFAGEASFEAMKEFSDTAVIVFGRTGGENNDLPTDMSPYSKSEEDAARHYLELNSAELSLLSQAKEAFAHVVILINSSHAMELGFLEDPDIDAALWIGGMGDVGSRAVAEVLNGEINPSGRTVDIYPYAVETIPSYYNFGEFAYTNSEGIFDRKESAPQTAFLVNYQEGIYVGYRYYETRKTYDYTTREGENVTGASYEEVVQFPFGYGQSYTSFDWKVEKAPEEEMNSDGTLEITVTVTNTGERAGKEVVQMYYSPPYYSEKEGSGIQKAEVVLADYGKTELLEPGESQTLTLRCRAEDMASYDERGYYAENGAYVLEKGDYCITLRENSHTVKDSCEFTCSLPETVVFSEEGKRTGDVKYVGKRSSDQVTAENHFQDVGGDVSYMNRDTWEIEEGSDREASPEQLEAFKNARELTDEYIDEGDTAPVMGSVTADHRLSLEELTGKDYEDLLWEDLLNQLSWKDMEQMLAANGWGSSMVKSIGKPQVYDMDGPSAISYILDVFMNRVTYKSITYPSEVVMASTWNRELAAEFGKVISEEGKVFHVSGWYAPGVNIHRNPFAGRNFEYYSEDPCLSGTIAASVIQAAQENGMYCYLKHFVLNEMETNRHYGLCTWASEQSMREIYMRAFEIPVKETDMTALMSSYNNLGVTWAGCSRALLTDVLRREWGFTGTVLTDNFENQGFMDAETALAAGGTALLCNMNSQNLSRLKSTASGQQIVRNAAHQYLYTIANSLAMENECVMPVWRKAALILSLALYALSAWLIIRNLILKENRRKR